MNYISLTGSLLNISSENKNIRYIKYVRTYKDKIDVEKLKIEITDSVFKNVSYKDKKGIFQEDIFPCMWWTRDSNNELFSLQDNSYVAVSGRIERYEHEFIIVIELLEYLGIKR